MIDDYGPMPVHGSLRTQVYDILEDLILEGRIQAGERLVESKLADRLGVSRGPIREALQQLERDGWLEARPRQGTYVRKPSRAELEDYFRVRSILEADAAAQAAERIRKADPDAVASLEELRALVRESRTLESALDGDQQDPDTLRRFRDGSRRFHYILAAMSGSNALAELLTYLGKRTRWYFSSVGMQTRHEPLDEHYALIEAISDGDAARATALMRQHMEHIQLSSIETV